MTPELYLLTCFIAVVCYLWHRCAVAQHQEVVKMELATERMMREWLERNEFDLDDWM